MPGFPALDAAAVHAMAQFVITGEETPVPQRGRGRAGAAPAASPLIDNSFRFTGYRRFLDPDGYPAVAPPWGTLNALDVNSGDWVWKVPLGEYPALAAQGVTDTGSENYGGPIVTAGGLVIIAATNHDRKIRAFDKATGALLWQATMPSSSNATPAVYEVNGRQFIAVAAGGGKSPTGGPGGVYVAFALPN
jgi:quinoprotein glucose dehydrogenase